MDLKTELQRCLRTLSDEDPGTEKYNRVLDGVQRICWLIGAPAYEDISGGQKGAAPITEVPPEPAESAAEEEETNTDKLPDMPPEELEALRKKRFDEVRARLWQLREAKNVPVSKLLGELGASKLSELDPRLYDTLLQRAEEGC